MSCGTIPATATATADSAGTAAAAAAVDKWNTFGYTQNSANKPTLRFI